MVSFLIFLLIKDALSYIDSMCTKLVYAWIEPSTLEGNRDYCRVVTNDDTIKLELVATIINMDKFT